MVWEAHSEGWARLRGMEVVGSPPRSAGRIGSLFQRPGQGWEVHPVGREGSEGPFREPRRVRMAGSGRKFHPEGVVGRPSRRNGRGREGQEVSGCPQEGRDIRRPSWRARRSREGQERLGGSPGGLGGVSRDGRVWEALPESLDGLGGHPGWVGAVGRPFWRAVMGWEALEKGLGGVGRAGRGWEYLQEGWERSGDTSKGLGENGRAERDWEALPEGQ